MRLKYLAVVAGTLLSAAPQLRAQPSGTGDPLPTVVVTGTRSEKTLDETPVRTEVVDRQEIERTHARTLKDALENVPGLQLREIHGKSGYEVTLQGMTSDQVLVLIDGLPISASTGSTVDVSQYLLTEVDRVEVVKGASSAQYGSSAMGGVINVITRPIDKGFSGAVTADAGSYGGQNADGSPGALHGNVRLEGGTEQFRARISADGLDNKGFAVEPDGWTRRGDKIRREQYAGRLEWLPSQAGRVWFDASAYRETDEQRYQYYVPPRYVPQRKTEDIDRNRYTYGGQWRFDNGVRARLAGVHETYDSTSREYSNDFRTAERKSAQQTDHVSAQFDLPAWYRQLWQFGGDFHRETLDQSVNGTSELAGAGSASRQSGELYLQNDILLSETWEVIAGLRGQHDSDFGSHFAPKVGVRANLLSTDTWKGVLRANYGQGYRVPNLKERHYLFDHSSLGYIVLGNPDLKPESSHSFQLGGQLSWRDRVTVDANLFYNRVTDLIQTDMTNFTMVNGIAVYTYRNVARARTQGAETSLRWRASNTLNLTAAYTFTDTEDLNTGAELTRRPRHMGRLGADWRLFPSTELTTRARFQSSELTDAATGARSPGWGTLDLVLNQKIGKSVTAFVGVNNLFDRQRDFANASDFGPVAGRFIYLGARFRVDVAR
ncbi:TonB-dependent receptor [Cupriavidus sp. SZY C1]|uniref:TonB-dependent receptor plug domain-containing protein n=1 Tax=Cupriavidus sp. SZY C1 TaxID=3055037 RepID=UPI0028BCD3B5|nr:TonB-dependent receptor [Cupriavidus sp. SZY C1]MDT6962842.1 TonB-dependent receptor [Cupriavidus sp. SZY C1]